MRTLEGLLYNLFTNNNAIQIRPAFFRELANEIAEKRVSSDVRIKEF